MVVLGGVAVSYERGTHVGLDLIVGAALGDQRDGQRRLVFFITLKLYRNVQRFRGGLVRAHRLLYHSDLMMGAALGDQRDRQRRLVRQQLALQGRVDM